MTATQPKIELSDTMSDLKDFLERLGTSIDIPREHRVVAKNRTALGGPQVQEFNVVSSNSDRLLKRTPNILAPGVDLPDDLTEYDRVEYFTDFLDRSVQAEEIVRQELLREDLLRERENFVPQHVRRNGSETSQDSVQVFRDWLRDESKNVLAVLAPAGYGKTALTCEATYQLGHDYLEREADGPEPFPLRVNFGEYRLASDFESMIHKALNRVNVFDVHSNAFAFLVDRRRSVLILDGFDELLETRPDEAKRNLRELIETLGSSGKVIITARSTFFRTSEQVADFLEYGVDENGVDVVELLPFNDRQKQQFIQGKCDNQTEINRVWKFVNSPKLEEPLGSPLLLNETVDLLMEEEGSSRLDREGGRLSLFEALESSVYSRERIRHGHDFTDEEQRAFLLNLAEELFKDNERGYDKISLEVLASEALQKLGRAIEGPEGDLLIDHHFLTSSDSDLEPERRPIYFNHQVFREYFQALSCVRSTASDNGTFANLMVSRPIPEEVASWCAEVDTESRLPTYLLGRLDSVSDPSPLLQENLAAVSVAYQDTAFVEGFLSDCPKSSALELHLRDLDLSGIDFSDRFFTTLELTRCKLDGTSFVGSSINELTLNECESEGLDVQGCEIDSAAFDYGVRIFDSPSLMREMGTRGAITGIVSPDEVEKATRKQTDRVREIVKSRLHRFYVKGAAQDGSASKWKGEIVERNLYGGLVHTERKWAKSKVVPAMVTENVIERRRVNADWRYKVCEQAEDDARALLESDEERGCVAELIERLERREH